MSSALGVQGVPFTSSSQSTDQNCISSILTAVIETVSRIWAALVGAIQMIFCCFGSSETFTIGTSTAPAVAPVAAPANNLDNLILTIDQQNAIKNAPLVRAFRNWLSAISRTPNYLNGLDTMSVREEERPFLNLARDMKRVGAANLLYYISVTPSQYRRDHPSTNGSMDYFSFVRLQSDIETLLPEAIRTGNARPLYDIVPLGEQDMSANLRAHISMDVNDIVASTPIHREGSPSPVTSELIADIRRVDGFVRFLRQASTQSNLEAFLTRTLVDSNEEIVKYSVITQHFLRNQMSLRTLTILMENKAFIALLPSAIATRSITPLLDLAGTLRSV